MTARSVLVFLLLLTAHTLVLAQGPVAWWPFDGNTRDITGNGHDAVNSGAVLTSDRFGNLNSAYWFDGQTDMMQAPGSRLVTFDSARDFSVSVWMKSCVHHPYGPNAQFVARANATDNSFALGLSCGNCFVFTHCTADLMGVPGLGGISGGPMLHDGRWHHIVETRTNGPLTGPDKSRWHLYVDGIRVRATRGEVAQRVWYHDDNVSAAILFGMEPYTGVRFNGALDDIRIYERRLSPAEIDSLYRVGGFNGTANIQLDVQAVGVGPLRICPGDSVQLRAQVTGSAQRLVWEELGGGSGSIRPSDSARQSLFVRPTRTTRYRVTAITGEPCPEAIDTSEITVVVTDPPRLAVNRAMWVCQGETALLRPLTEGGARPLRWRWSGSEPLARPTDSMQQVRVDRSATYYVEVTDLDGCRARDSITITMLPRPRLNLGRDTTLCRGSAITIGVEATGGNIPYSYRWSPSSGLSSDTVARPQADPDSTTTYTVEVRDVTGCVTRDTITVVVRPMPIAEAGSDHTLCLGESAPVGSPAASGVRYLWSPAPGLSDTSAAQPIAAPTTTTTYHLAVIDSLSGCTSIDSVTVTVLDARLATDRSGLSFGELDGCTSSREMAMLIENTGTSTARIDSATFGRSSFALVSPALPITFQPGEKITVVVRYAPGTAGAHSDTLVLHGDPCGVTATVPVSGSKEESLLFATLSRIDFGLSLACEQIERDTTVAIINNGTAPVTIGAAGVVAPFTVTAPALPATIQPGETLSVSLHYAPTRGSHATDLALPYESGTCRDTLRVVLVGVHELPVLAAEPSILDVGRLTGCESQRDTVITLRNSGLVPLAIDSSMLPADWRLLDATGGTLAPGATRTLRLRYAPGANGTSSGTWRVSFGPCDQVLAIDLRGEKQGVVFALPDTVDFGSIVACGDTTVTRSVQIVYTGDAGSSGTVGSVTATSGVATTLAPGTRLPNGAPLSFDVTAALTRDGSFNGTVTVQLEPCGVTRTIVVTGSRTSATLTALPLDFGQVASGASVTGEVVVVNSGSAPAVVDVADIVGNADGVFAIDATVPTLPATLAPGDTLHLQVRFTAKPDVHAARARLALSSPCSSEIIADLRGEGTASGIATLTLPTITAAAGDRFSIDIALSDGAFLDQINARAFEGVIAVDRTLMISADRSAETVDATTRHIRFTGTRTDTAGVLISLPMTALLGSAERTPIVLESFRFTDVADSVPLRVIAGEFILDGICREGGARLYDADGTLVLRPVRPNPTSQLVSIEYALVEDGPTRLEIYDMSGRRVKTLVDRVMRPREYVAFADVGEFAAGQYLVVLATPTLVLREGMVVGR